MHHWHWITLSTLEDQRRFYKCGLKTWHYYLHHWPQLAVTWYPPIFLFKGSLLIGLSDVASNVIEIWQSCVVHCAAKILQCRRDGSIPRRSWFSHFNLKRKKCWSWPCGIFASCKPANFSLLRPSKVRTNKNYSSKQHKKSRTTYPPIPRSSVYLKQNRPKLQLRDDHLVK